MTHLTTPEAVEFFEATYFTAPDSVGDSVVEGFVGGYDVADVRTDLETFCDFVQMATGRQIDPDSYTITADHVEGMDIPATKVTIKTKEAA